jgi:hypothetical protein
MLLSKWFPRAWACCLLKIVGAHVQSMIDWKPLQIVMNYGIQEHLITSMCHITTRELRQRRSNFTWTGSFWRWSTNGRSSCQSTPWNGWSNWNYHVLSSNHIMRISSPFNLAIIITTNLCLYFHEKIFMHRIKVTSQCINQWEEMSGSEVAAMIACSCFVVRLETQVHILQLSFWCPFLSKSSI